MYMAIGGLMTKYRKVNRSVPLPLEEAGIPTMGQTPSPPFFPIRRLFTRKLETNSMTHNKDALVQKFCLLYV